MLEQQIASIIGFESIEGGLPRRAALGYVAAPERAGGYYLAFSTAGCHHPRYCLGGATTVEAAAAIVRRWWGYPSEFKSSYIGKWIRRR